MDLSCNMKSFFERLLQLFYYEEYEALGTHQYWYEEEAGGVKLLIISVTFYMSKLGKRKIELDFNKDRKDCHPKDHKFYHNICVPYLNKTFPFNLTDIGTKEVISIMCEESVRVICGDVDKRFLSDKTPVRKVDITYSDNIIDFSEYNRDK